MPPLPTPMLELADFFPTSLATYLTIYRKAQKVCYTEYMEGAKLLAEWLYPIELPANVPHLPANNLLRSYETVSLATVLAGKAYGPEHAAYLEAIIYLEIQELYTHD
jgi:hypothetical protein